MTTIRHSLDAYRYRRDIIAGLEEPTLEELYAWSGLGAGLSRRARLGHDRPMWRRVASFCGGVVAVWAR